MDTTTITLLASLASLITIGFALKTNLWILRQDSGNDKMIEIAKSIKEGAYAFLNREYSAISTVAIIIIIIMWIFYSHIAAISFTIGAIGSALAGFLGMMVNVRANVRTAQAANNGIKSAFNIAYRGGTVTGNMVIGLALLSVTGYSYFTQENVHEALLGLMLGASLISVFARVGGGIFTKAADVGADLVGKVEENIPEDDPRNPAVIADNVGDNVGDCAGMAADIYETFIVTFSASILLIITLLGKDTPWVFFPILIGGVAIIASLISSAFTFLGKNGNVMKAFYQALILCAVLTTLGVWGLSDYFLAIPEVQPIFTSEQLFYLMSTGVFLTVIIMFITDYYTSSLFKPVRSIALASESGHATNIIIGHSIGLKSTVPVVSCIAVAIIISYWVGGGFVGNENIGLIAISFTAVAMVSMTGMIIAIDAYGPITDNAGGIAEMSEAPAKVRKITDKLDAYGNTTKATTKGFAIASAGLATLVLFSEYARSFDEKVIFNISDPMVLVGLFLGGTFAFWFASKLLQAVGDTAKFVVEEVRKQFKDGQILKGHKKPDYGKCVSIVTKASLIQMIIPATACVITPIVIGFNFGKLTLGGFNIGVVVIGLLLAVSMTNSGGASDNAKKHIEDGHHGGKGSDAHKAAITGDTVGDPRKDTAGPAINPMIKVINIVSLIIAPFI